MHAEGHCLCACKLLVPRGALRQAVAVTQVEPLGGGRIEVQGRSATIYGYSQTFGQAPHDISAALVRRCYPLLNVQVSYEGY